MKFLNQGSQIAKLLDYTKITTILKTQLKRYVAILWAYKKTQLLSFLTDLPILDKSKHHTFSLHFFQKIFQSRYIKSRSLNLR